MANKHLFLKECLFLVLKELVDGHSSAWLDLLYLESLPCLLEGLRLLILPIMLECFTC